VGKERKEEGRGRVRGREGREDFIQKCENMLHIFMHLHHNQESTVQYHYVRQIKELARG